MRRTMALVPLLLAGGAVAEIAVFVVVARWLGLPWAALLLLTTSVLGVLLLRREGIRAWRRFRLAFEAKEPPGVRVADGLVGLVGALLLAVPGFLTDALGLLLLLPFIRPLARRQVQRTAERRMPSRLAGDVFGPRRVRLRYGRMRDGRIRDGRLRDGVRPDPGPSTGAEPGVPGARDAALGGAGGPDPGSGPPTGPVVRGEIVEGEIIDPAPDPDARP